MNKNNECLICKELSMEGSICARCKLISSTMFFFKKIDNNSSDDQIEILIGQNLNKSMKLDKYSSERPAFLTKIIAIDEQFEIYSRAIENYQISSVKVADDNGDVIKDLIIESVENLFYISIVKPLRLIALLFKEKDKPASLRWFELLFKAQSQLTGTYPDDLIKDYIEYAKVSCHLGDFDRSYELFIKAALLLGEWKYDLSDEELYHKEILSFIKSLARMNDQAHDLAQLTRFIKENNELLNRINNQTSQIDDIKKILSKSEPIQNNLSDKYLFLEELENIAKKNNDLKLQSIINTFRTDKSHFFTDARKYIESVFSKKFNINSFKLVKVASFIEKNCHPINFKISTEIKSLAGTTNIYSHNHEEYPPEIVELDALSVLMNIFQIIIFLDKAEITGDFQEFINEFKRLF